MELDPALDRFWEAADARRLGIDSIQVVTVLWDADARKPVAFAAQERARLATY